MVIPHASFAALLTGLAAALTGDSTGGVVSPAAKTPPDAEALLVESPAHDTAVYDTDEQKVLYIYNWSDYIDLDVLARFKRETGIEVNYELLESNEKLEAKLRTGHVDYDVIFPSALFLQREIQFGFVRKLDKSRLPHLRNVDPDIAHKLALLDPGNEYAVNYQWGTSGIAYNTQAVAAALPDAPIDSLAMIWDPQVVSKFADCGVAMLDTPSEVIGSALIYLGKDANSENPADLAAAEKVMMAARPYISLFSNDYVDELSSGKVCVGLSWSSDAMQAKGAALNEGKPIDIRYSLPREGAFMFLDNMAIPRDARHVKNAHIFIDYLLRADVAARNSNFTGFANGNAASQSLIDRYLAEDQNLFPSPQMRQKLVPDVGESAEFTRQMMLTWSRFRPGNKLKTH